MTNTSKQIRLRALPLLHKAGMGGRGSSSYAIAALLVTLLPPILFAQPGKSAFMDYVWIENVVHDWILWLVNGLSCFSLSWIF